MARVLIAEDDELVAGALEQALHRRGFTTRVVGDGCAAAELGLRDEYDLMILDLGLPGCDGYEVLEVLRSARCRIPVIVLTGRGNPGDAETCLNAGADDYMTKPFRFDELLARVHVRLRPGPARL